MTLVLDAGAFLAVERGNRDIAALLKGELLAGRTPLTSGAVIGQIWRGGGGKQANIARLLHATEIAPLDDTLGRRVGMLLARARTADVVDAAVVLLATPGDLILTSDAADLRPLAEAAGITVAILAV